MSWNPEKIRELRLRLGWSPSDLARRLHCESASISSWESGKVLPNDGQLQLLELLDRQADAYADEVSQTALADSVLDHAEVGSIEQINLQVVKRKFTENQ